VPYPVACHPQAWSAGAIPYMLTCGLGLVPDGFGRRLRVVRPTLPRWVDHVELRGLPVAGSSVDLRFERAGEAVALTEARVAGDVAVVTEL
jgi:glycogen debranching enzyme